MGRRAKETSLNGSSRFQKFKPFKSLKVRPRSFNIFEDSVTRNKEVSDESSRLGKNIRGDGQENYREIRATTERGANWKAATSEIPAVNNS
jgi:hypothetical protein